MRVASLRPLLLALAPWSFVVACGGTTLPAAGSDASDGASDAPSDGGCGAGTHPGYATPACGAATTTTCFPDGPEDACAGLFCGCDGVTFYGACGYADRPFAALGPCEDAGDAGAFACGTTTCSADQICEKLQIEGGPLLLPDDAGVCPSGTENVGGYCQQPPRYACVAKPTTCGATIDCACAGDLCRAISSCPYMCQGTSGREVDCVCAVP